MKRKQGRKNDFERQVWINFQSGQLSAFSTLVDIYYPMLFTYGMRLAQNRELTKDALHEFFLYVFEKRETLNIPDSVKGYMMSSFRRHILRKVLAERKRPFEKSELRRKDISSEEPHKFEADRALEKEKRACLLRALKTLPWKQQECIFLRYYNNLTLETIAEIMDIKYQSVVNNIYRGLQKIRKQLGLEL